MNGTASDALVVYGVTGDLAYKKVFPALHAIIRRGTLNVPILGMARAGWSLDELRARAKQSIEEHGELDPVAYAKLCQLLRYVGGNYEDPETAHVVREALSGAS